MPAHLLHVQIRQVEKNEANELHVLQVCGHTFITRPLIICYQTGLLMHAQILTFVPAFKRIKFNKQR